MLSPGGDLRVIRAVVGKVALAAVVGAHGNGAAVASEKHRVADPRSGLQVLDALLHGEEVALAVFVPAHCDGAPVAPEKHGVFPAGGDHGLHRTRRMRLEHQENMAVTNAVFLSAPAIFRAPCGCGEHLAR